MLRYMKKAEQFVSPSSAQVGSGAIFEASAHGTSGPLPVGFPMPYNSGVVFSDFVAAVIRVIPGLKKVDDLGSGLNNGVGRNLFSMKPGASGTTGGNLRSTSATGYIYPFLSSKPGLTILLGHQATGIVWSNGTHRSRATGVNFIPTPTAGATVPSPFSVKLSKEVLVAAGAIGVR